MRAGDITFQCELHIAARWHGWKCGGICGILVGPTLPCGIINDSLINAVVASLGVKADTFFDLDRFERSEERIGQSRLAAVKPK